QWRRHEVLENSMKLYQKVCAVIACEGMSGLLRRIICKFFITDEERSNDEGSKVREDYERLVSDFNARALAMGYGDINKYYWYHTIDFLQWSCHTRNLRLSDSSASIPIS